MNDKKLVHCITNAISMNQCANAILALGARPIMAEHPLEVEEITATADALLLNFGNISDSKMLSMKKSIVVANGRDIPVVIDAVGVACSRLRRQFFMELMELGRAFLIKGNYSEILAISDSDYRSTGIDAEKGIGKDEIEKACRIVSDKFNAAVLATGQIDYLSYKNKIYAIESGCSQLGEVTGTGCMLGAIEASYLAEEQSVNAIIAGVKFFGECGIKAKTNNGIGTFMGNLLDELGANNKNVKEKEKID